MQVLFNILNKETNSLQGNNMEWNLIIKIQLYMILKNLFPWTILTVVPITTNSKFEK